jgi:RNA polymerase sigma-70 factor (ECF subfamily)
MEDRQIIELYNERSELAIAETSSKYGNYCKAIAMRILEDLRDAEECVSDALMRVWNAIPPAVPNNLKLFIAKITRNLALDRVDYNNAEKRGGGQVFLALDELAECVSGTDDIELEDGTVTEVLNKFLAGLEPEAREMFVRRYWYLDSIREIARTMNCTESKVKTTLYRERKILKEKLGEEGISYGQ